MQLPPGHRCQGGEGPSAALAHPDARKPHSHQPNRKQDKNITLMSKSPSAGSTFLMRFPTPAGKQSAGRGVCKAAAAGGSRSVQLWGCVYAAATARHEAEEPPAPSPDAAPSCIVYVFSCIFKARLISLFICCPVTVQLLLGRSGEPTETG